MRGVGGARACRRPRPWAGLVPAGPGRARPLSGFGRGGKARCEELAVPGQRRRRAAAPRVPKRRPGALEAGLAFAARSRRAPLRAGVAAE